MGVDLDELLDVACLAAREAAAILRQSTTWEERPSQSRDVKLDADVQAEAIIRKRLAPFAPVFGEELGGSLGGSMTWIVDPLDGTVNFSRGIPISSISIALWNDGPLLGVVYDFNRDEMFSGHVGRGCFLNGNPVHPSNNVDISSSILLTGMPVGGSFEDSDTKLLVEFMTKFKKVRLIGSAALSLAWVASGRADFYFENGIRIWDVGAGLALLASAGAKFSITGAEFLTVYGHCPNIVIGDLLINFSSGNINHVN